MNNLISNIPPNEITIKVVNIAEKMKSNKCDFTISEIILRTDKPDLTKKGNELNIQFKEVRKEKKIFLIDHGKKIKANYLNSSKLHLKGRGAKTVSTSFLQTSSKVLKWQLPGNSSECIFSTFSFKKHGSDQAKVDCQCVSKSLRKDNLCQLTFAH